ncbi:Heme-binding protein 1-like 2 [Homarus americanus]|uniref:Heme-binding protein 1-like 2 n=1 Tax=Homarus americanus TaxID=6706 RepID=A0A8J5K1P7_HOMAM|nr:Heme-binding protein 1-like 2 [Homarus americanus]
MKDLVVVIMVGVTVFSCQPTNGANLFTAFSRSFGPTEPVTFTTVRRAGRLYQAKFWACTEHHGAQYTIDDKLELFYRLFAYIGGKNSKGEKLVLGIPVSIEHNISDEEHIFNACFFIPEAAQADPPTPTDPNVHITLRPQMTILTRRLGGYATDETTWNTETEKLTSIITAAGEHVIPNHVFWNAYDPPFKFWNRRNEVWLVKE